MPAHMLTPLPAVSGCLSCATCSCTLLAASLVVEKGRLALLALLGVVNVAVVAIFLYHICKQLWLWVGAPASKAVGTAYKNSKGWWEDRVSSQLRPKLQALRGKWPPSWWRGGPPSDGDDGDGPAAGGWRSAVDSLWQKVQGWGRRIRRRQKEQPQQEEEEDKDGTEQQQQQRQRQANVHASPHANGHAPPAQRQANGCSDRKQARSDLQTTATNQQQRAQQQANGSIVPPLLSAASGQQQQAQRANGSVPQLQGDGSTGPAPPQQKQQANGGVPQLQGDSSGPPAVQQQQQPAVPQHTIHQIPVTGRR